jgi:hypothetical protein
MERILRAVLLASALAAAPAAAEVVTVHPTGFVVRHEVVVEADTKATWLALISPATWWRKEHTWSGDAANLSLMPSAGGCFCERIPEVDEPGRFTLEGSVEHMRVIQSQPEAALRMRGGLGPLQSEPVTGVLTIAISKADKGTRLVWEYNVAGYMRYEIPVISKAVDGVIGLQAAALGDLLGRVDAPASAADKEETKPAADEKPADKRAAPPPEKPAGAPAKPATATKPKLDEAFGDLIGD